MSENSFGYMACGARMYTKNCRDRSVNEQAHNGLIYPAYRAITCIPFARAILIGFEFIVLSKELGNF